MKPHHPIRSAALLALALTALLAPARAQYVPSTPARPFPGYVNEDFRNSDVYMNAWDIGVNVRGRLEGKDGAGFTYAGQNADFRLTGSGLNNDNHTQYFLTRTMPRVGYTARWYAFLAEG